VPDGLRLTVEPDGITVGGTPRDGAPLLVWQLDTARPAWADF
jgi:hypothetical protein